MALPKPPGGRGCNVPRFSCTLLERRWFGDEVFELRFSRPQGFDFLPGQRIDLYRDTDQRSYSLVSTPAQQHLALCVGQVPNGRISPWLATLSPGSPLTITGPHGYFTFQPSSRRAIFVAAGTGIAPFASMIRSGTENVILLQGAPDIRHAFYAEKLAPGVRFYRACLSRETPAEAPFPTFTGRVTDYRDRQLPEDAYDFYLCGQAKMVRDAVRIIDRRFPDARVRMEMFS